MVKFALNRWGPLRFVGFSSKLVGGPLLGPPVGVPSLVLIGSKLKIFSLLLGRRHCVASLPHPGCLLPPLARPYAAFSCPVLPCSQRPKIFKVHKHGYIGAWNCHNFFYCKSDSYQTYNTHRQWLDAFICQIWSESDEIFHILPCKHGILTYIIEFAYPQKWKFLIYHLGKEFQSF